MKCGARPRIAGSLFLALLTPPCCADPAPVIHYAPGENLEHIDVALIDRAEREIDMAAYVLTDVLTDWAVMQALTRAADRGVAIREPIWIGFCNLHDQGIQTVPHETVGRNELDCTP
jgi:hypothetical protein